MEHNFYPIFKEKPASLSACAFSPNSKFLAVGSVDSVVKLWDLKSDKNQKDQSISQIKSHLGAISSLAWIKSLKGEGYGTETLASASTSGDIYIHSNKSGEFVQSNYLKMQEGINCIRVSESMDFCRLAACTNGGSLSYHAFYVGFGI
jgi:WD40 repeat protein